MKVYRVPNFEFNRGEEVNIFFLGDIHEGNINHDAESLKKAVNIIKETPNSYCILMGNLIDAKLPSNKKHFDPTTISKDYQVEDFEDLPRIQIKKIIKKLEPIKDKILAIVKGNHEFNVAKYHSYNVYMDLCERLEAEPMDYVGIIKLGFIIDPGRDRANFTKTIMVNHGDGGGGFREGYPTNKLHDVFRWSDCDINVMGHIHQLVADDKKHFTVTQSDKLLMKRRFYGVSGCFLRTYVDGNRNYFEHKGRFDSDIGFLQCKIVLKDNEPDIYMQTIKLR